jgi:hypothetical protein
VTDFETLRPQGTPARRRPLRRAFAQVAWVATLATLLVAASVIVLTMADTAPSVTAAPPEGFDLVSDAPETPAGPPATREPAETSAPPSPPPVAIRPPVAVAPEGSDAEAAERRARRTVPVTSGLVLEGSEAPAPVRLRIPALGVDAPIDGVGVDGSAMDIPASADLVAWYEYGPRPGEPGSSVLAAHVDWGGRRGAFFDLRDIPPGALVEVEFADGGVRRFEVVRLTSYDKDDLPVDDIFRRDGEPIVTLITCGGAFNPSLRSYEDNVVAYAREIVSPLR